MKKMITLILSMLSIMFTVIVEVFVNNNRSIRTPFWWFIILIFGPISMLWNSCEYRPIVQKRNELIRVNCKGAKTMSNEEIEKAYQYGMENEWFSK